MNLNNYFGIDTKDLTNIPPDKDKREVFGEMQNLWL